MGFQEQDNLRQPEEIVGVSLLKMLSFGSAFQLGEEEGLVQTIWTESSPNGKQHFVHSLYEE